MVDDADEYEDEGFEEEPKQQSTSQKPKRRESIDSESTKKKVQ